MVGKIKGKAGSPRFLNRRFRRTGMYRSKFLFYFGTVGSFGFLAGLAFAYVACVDGFILREFAAYG